MTKKIQVIYNEINDKDRKVSVSNNKGGKTMDYSFSSSAVRQVANDVRNVDATNIETGAKNVQNIGNTVQTAWQGTDANAYVNALNNYVPEILRLAETLRIIATTLDQTANLMDEREQERRARASQELSAN